MARHTDLIARRNADIRRDYERLLTRCRSNGQARLPAIMRLLQRRYYLSERTIADIIWPRREAA